MENKINKKSIFHDNDSYRFNAKVKWYYNKQTNGEYGFLEIMGIGDIHFSGSVFLYKDPKKLNPGDEVVVTLNQKEFHSKPNKIKATSVNLISDEKDLDYLLFYFINNFQDQNRNLEIVINQIDALKDQLNQNTLKVIEKLISEKIKLQELDLDKFKLIYILQKSCNIDLTNLIDFISHLSPDKIFNYWLFIEELEVDFQIIKDSLTNYVKLNLKKSNKILDRISESDRKEILNQIFTEKSTTNDYYNYELLVLIIDLFKQYEISINYNIIQEDLLLRLWENKIISYFPFVPIYNKLINFKKDYYNTNSADEKSKYFSSASAYIDKITNVDFKNILAKTHFGKDTIIEKYTFQTITFFIDLISEIETKNEFIAEIFNKADSYYKLQLFVLDYIDDVDYNDVVIYTGLLSSKDQKIFFKKILKLIAEEKLQLTIDDLQKITTIDYQISEYSKEIDGVGLDFTLSVILKMIDDLKNGTSTTRNTIFDIVASQVKRPKDLLVIDGFFEKCTGKTIIETDQIIVDEETKEKAITYKKVKKEKFLPRFSTFCDGRKASKKGTNEITLCNKSGFEFWWCENSQCYEPCRTKHQPQQWRNYSLEDVLTILQIQYDPTQYEIMLNVINRVNRFLSHLSCRKCNSIIKPKGKSNYSFYGVTRFICDNNDCTEKDNEIYLSHCLNGKCEDIIDSRDSVKCKTHGYTEECGWYICKNCNACCSTEKLVARKSYLENFGQEYKCHIEGHRNRGILCCSDCGAEMIESQLTSDLFKKQLDWFIEHKDKHANITKYGQRPKDNKWWFIWRRGQFSYEDYREQLQRLVSSGFNIPDFNNKAKDNQLIAEPFEETKFSTDNVFVCPDCDHRLDLNTIDFTRKNAIQSFHTTIFKHIEI